MTDSIPTTLNAIRKHSPCKGGWENLLKYLGKTKADDEPILFSTIAESNGIDDALWCLRSLPEEHHSTIRVLAADYAERVLPLYEERHPKDDRPRKAIAVARLHAEGKATDKKLSAAGEAAGAAWVARAAAWAARAAAGAAGEAEKSIQTELLIQYFG